MLIQLMVMVFQGGKSDDYGKLSGRKLEDMQAGSRIDIDRRKENPMDFALWKASKPGEPFWLSPWGEGRPGWHIECSAMNLHHLGEQIDIHGGGNDLIFPHHENEIAQTESLTDKQFARYWVHNGMLQLADEKMSKSLGNFVSIEEFLAKHNADAFRYLILNSGYRNPLRYNEEIVLQAEKAIERLLSAVRPAEAGATGVDQMHLDELNNQMAATHAGFEQSMDDDFNSAGALGYIYELVRVINSERAEGATDSQLADAQTLLKELCGVLGLRLESESTSNQAVEPFIQLLIDLRLELRKEKLYALSDRIRDRLTELGVTLEDGKGGTTWRVK